MGHFLASQMWNIYFLGGIVYINIVNDAALECTIEIFSGSDSKKNTYASSDCLSTIPVSYIFNFASSILGDNAADNSKKYCNIVVRKKIW